jgi:disulfide bond formation protein DsbB
VSAPVGGLSTDDLLARIMAAPLIRCDQIVWKFLGLTMAGWNALISLGLAGGLALALRAYASSSASQYR